MDWFINKAKEPSTINGILVLAGLAGINVSPDLQGPIVSIIGGAAALYNIIRKES